MTFIKEHLLEIFVFGVAVLAIGASFILCLHSYNNFCDGFLGNLLSDSIIALVFGFLLLRFYEGRNHPEPTLVIVDTDSLNEFVISKESAKSDGFVLKFGVRNIKRKALQKRDGFYHIYISKDIAPEIRRGTSCTEILEDLSEQPNFKDLHDENPGPCLYNSILTMVDVACHLKQDLDETTIYYYFNTESGIYPKSAKLGDEKDYFKGLGKITIRFT